MLLLYDNTCYYCSIFAYIAVRLSANRLTPVGLYSKEGDELMALFPKGVDPYEMFWIVDGSYAYGGLDALFKLLKIIILNLPKIIYNCYYNNSKPRYSTRICLECSSKCGLVARIYNLLSKRSKVMLNGSIIIN